MQDMRSNDDETAGEADRTWRRPVLEMLSADETAVGAGGSEDGYGES